MKKLLAILLLTAVTLSASGCGFLQEGSLRDLDYVTSLEETYVQDCMDRLTEALKTQDGQKLKGLFSRWAQEDAEDLDASIEVLLEQVGNNVISWELFPGGATSSEYVHDGNRTVHLKSWLALKTDTREYAVLLLAYPEDTIEPDNEGLFALLLFQEAYEEMGGGWGQWPDPGIFFPELQQNKPAEEYVQARMDQIVEVLREQDEQRLKNLFCVQTLENAEDLDASVEELFTQIGTNIISWEVCPDGIHSPVYHYYDKQLIEITAWVSLKTDTREYVLLISDSPVNDSYPSYEGLYALYLFREEYEEIDKSLADWSDPGVHIFADTERGEE